MRIRKRDRKNLFKYLNFVNIFVCGGRDEHSHCWARLQYGEIDR